MKGYDEPRALYSTGFGEFASDGSREISIRAVVAEERFLQTLS